MKPSRPTPNDAPDCNQSTEDNRGTRNRACISHPSDTLQGLLLLDYKSELTVASMVCTSRIQGHVAHDPSPDKVETETAAPACWSTVNVGSVGVEPCNSHQPTPSPIVAYEQRMSTLPSSVDQRRQSWPINAYVQQSRSIQKTTTMPTQYQIVNLEEILLSLSLSQRYLASQDAYSIDDDSTVDSLELARKRLR